MLNTTTAGDGLIEYLEEAGVRHIFGVPGDYVLSLYDLLVERLRNLVGTHAQASVALAADAYARVNGLGSVCVTYCVGVLNSLLHPVEQSGYPIATTLHSESVITERHPQNLGAYEEAMGRENVRRSVEESDFVVILGAFMTDVNLGLHAAQLNVSHRIYVTAERVSIKQHHYEGIQLRDFIDSLVGSIVSRSGKLPATSIQPRRGCAVTICRLFKRMNDFSEDNHVIIAGNEDSLFASADRTIHRREEFLIAAFDASMEFAFPAAVGAQINQRNVRPTVFVDDLEFQMAGASCPPLSSIRSIQLSWS